MKKILILSLSLLAVNCYAVDDNFRDDYAFASCGDVYASTKEQIPISSRNSYQVTNRDSFDQTFYVLYKLCDDRNKCTQKNKTIYVRSGHMYTENETLLEVAYEAHGKGDYPFKTWSEVRKQDNTVVLHGEQHCTLHVYKQGFNEGTTETN